MALKDPLMFPDEVRRVVEAARLIAGWLPHERWDRDSPAVFYTKALKRALRDLRKRQKEVGP